MSATNSFCGNLSTAAANKQAAFLKQKFSNLVETEYDKYQPYFYESDVSEDNALSFYDSSIAFTDSWHKFNLRTSRHVKTPTPTPIVSYNKTASIASTLADDENACMNNNNNSLSAIESTVDISCILKRIRTESLSAVSHNQQKADFVLRKDSMWSAPVEASCFGQKKNVSLSEGQGRGLDLDLTARATPTMHMFIGDISDYSDYSDEECEEVTSCSKASPVLVQQAGGDLNKMAATDESDAMDSDDDEEVDVVSVNKSQQGSGLRAQDSLLRHCALAVHRSVSMPLPAAASLITADVAAMHNYYSTPAPSNRTGDSVKSGSSTAAPSPAPGSAGSIVSNNRRSSTGSATTSLLVRRQKSAVITTPSSRARHVSKMAPSTALRNYPAPPAALPGSGGCGQRRELHNVLERKRRDDLRGNFNCLRDLLPVHGGGVQGPKERLAKVAILRRSCDYIRSLRRSFHDLSAEMGRLKSRHGELRARLKELERATADTSVHRG